MDFKFDEDKSLGYLKRNIEIKSHESSGHQSKKLKRKPGYLYNFSKDGLSLEIGSARPKLQRTNNLLIYNRENNNVLFNSKNINRP